MGHLFWRQFLYDPLLWLLTADLLNFIFISHSTPWAVNSFLLADDWLQCRCPNPIIFLCGLYGAFYLRANPLCVFAVAVYSKILRFIYISHFTPRGAYRVTQPLQFCLPTRLLEMSHSIPQNTPLRFLEKDFIVPHLFPILSVTILIPYLTPS